MRVYTVHLSSDPAADPLFLKEGFSFWAFLFPLPWALWNRLWIESAFWVLIGAALFVTRERLGISPSIITATGLAAQIIFAFEARDFLRARLKRNGWWQTAVIFERDQDAAVQRWYHRDGAER
ncbi:MAG: DUF2628 domain-containing protein [Alphaproteobacteria bacterium]